MVESAHHFNIGEFSCIVFNDGTLDAEGEIYGLNCLYIASGSHKILVDNGCGSGFQPATGKLVKNMEGEGIRCGDITHVIFTHGHVDHVCGTCDKQGNHIFPNARYIALAKEWDYWTEPPGDNEMQNMFFKPARKNLVPARQRFDLVKDNYEVLPGIKLIMAPGHTPGNLVIEITSRGEKLLGVGDIIHSQREFTDPKCLVAFDVAPEAAVKTKLKILTKAAKEGTFVFACHFTFPGLGYIREKNGVLGWEAI